MTLSIIYWEGPLTCGKVLPNPDPFDIEERVVDKAIGPLAVGRRQVDYLFSFQGALELKDRKDIKQTCLRFRFNFSKCNAILYFKKHYFPASVLNI